MKDLIGNFKNFLNEQNSYPLGEKDDIEKTSKVIVFDEDKNILILQRASHMKWSPKKWDLPGGHLKNKETSKDAAKREVKEETGLSIKKLVQIGEVGNIAVFKAIINKKNEIKLDDENSNYKWIKPNNINDYDFVPELISFVINLETNK
jgi:isopentenyldiphosphate isomerase